MNVEVMNLKADEKDLLMGLLRVHGAQKVMEQLQGNVNKRAQETTRIYQRATPELRAMLDTMWRGWFGIDGAIRGATKALSDLNREREQAAQRAREGEFPYAKLGQLAYGEPGKLEALVSQAEWAQGKYGLSQQQATDLIFGLESAGIRTTKTVGFFGELMPVLGGLSAQMAENVATLQRAFGNEMTGDIETTMNKLFMASKASKTRLEQFAGPAASAAQPVKRIGGTDVETYAAIALGSFALENVDEAATQIRAFAAQASKRGYGAGRGLLAAARNVQAQITAGGDINQLLPEMKAAGGFGILRDNLQDIEALQKRIFEAGKTAGTERDGLRQLLDEMRKPEFFRFIGAPAEARISEEQRNVAEHQFFSQEALKSQTAINRMDVAQMRAGTGWLSRWMRRKAVEGVAFVSPEAAMPVAREFERAPSGAASQILAPQILWMEQYNKLIMALLDALRENTAATKGNTDEAAATNRRRIPVR